MVLLILNRIFFLLLLLKISSGNPKDPLIYIHYRIFCRTLLSSRVYSVYGAEPCLDNNGSAALEFLTHSCRRIHIHSINCILKCFPNLAASHSSTVNLITNLPKSTYSKPWVPAFQGKNQNCLYSQDDF